MLAQSRGDQQRAGRRQDAPRPRPTWRINGNGFFVVEPTIGQSDGDARVRRRQLLHPPRRLRDRQGRLPGQRRGLLPQGPADRPGDAEISGSVPQVLRISNAFLPAQQTTRINYQLNLPQLPKTGSLQGVADRRQRTAAARRTSLTLTPAVDTRPRSGAAATGGAAIVDHRLTTGDTLTITVNGAPVNFAFNDGGGDLPAPTSTSTATTSGRLDHDRPDRDPGGAAGRRATVGIGGGAISRHCGQHHRHRSPSPTAPTGTTRPLASISADAHDRPDRARRRSASRPASTTSRADDERRVHRPVDLGRRHHGLCRERRAGQRADALGQGQPHRQWRRRALEPVHPDQRAGHRHQPMWTACRRRLHLRRRWLAQPGRSTTPTSQASPSTA